MITLGFVLNMDSQCHEVRYLQKGGDHGDGCDCQDYVFVTHILLADPTQDNQASEETEIDGQPERYCVRQQAEVCKYLKRSIKLQSLE